jgi:hypothetical protein
MGVSQFTYDRAIPRLTIGWIGQADQTAEQHPGENKLMNAPRRSHCSVEPGPETFERDDFYPDAPVRKFSRSARAPVEIAINVAIDAAVITAIVVVILLVSTPWLLR